MSQFALLVLDEGNSQVVIIHHLLILKLIAVFSIIRLIGSCATSIIQTYKEEQRRLYWDSPLALSLMERSADSSKFNRALRLTQFADRLL